MYANGSNGRWEPLVEPAELTLATEHNRRTKDYQLELSSAAPLNVNITAALLDTLLRTHQHLRRRSDVRCRHERTVSDHALRRRLHRRRKRRQAD